MDIPIEERYPHLAYPMETIPIMLENLRALRARLRNYSEVEKADQGYSA
jgi:hypothetical protein